MTREEQLLFCKVCDHKSFDPSKGIICILTNEQADFESSCVNFTGAIEDIKSEVPALSEENAGNEFLGILLPKKGFIITPLIAYACMALFVIMALLGVDIMEPLGEDLAKWGANIKQLVLGGEYWRLLTNVFLHIGLIHLLGNFLALLYIGSLLEPFIGKWKLLLAYLLTGIFASTVSLWYHSLAISAGASGAIFGLFGVYIALATTKLTDKKNKQKIVLSLIAFVTYNLLYGLQANIDNAAHIGGLICGILLGYTFYFPLSKPHRKTFNQLFTIGSTTVLTTIAFLFVFTSNIYYFEYEKTISSYVQTETKTINYISQMVSSPALSDQQKSERAIERWEECKMIISRVNAIPGLPPKNYEIANLIELFCNYKIAIFRIYGVLSQSPQSGLNYIVEKYNQKLLLISDKLNGEKVHNEKFIYSNPIDDIVKEMPDGTLLVKNGEVRKKLENTDPLDVVSIRILSQYEGRKIYGKKGRDGVFLIATKKLPDNNNNESNDNN